VKKNKKKKASYFLCVFIDSVERSAQKKEKQASEFNIGWGESSIGGR
jgi:hypothetical protein